MISDRTYPAELQYRPSRIELDGAVEQAKATLLNDIKRSVYIYRCDLGGCNGCEIEIFSTITPVFDAERFGIKNTASPRHADILVYTGAVTRAMRMPGIRAYEAAPDPKLVVAYGACGCSGGIFHDCYCTWGGTNELFPVDVYIPGCPPSPAQTIYGFAMVLGKLGQKLKHVDEVGGSEAVGLAFADVPYKVRTAIEREARLMSGYQVGFDLSAEFMAALNAPGDALANVEALIAEQEDPRKVEVLAHLGDVLSDMLVVDRRAGADVASVMSTVSAPLGSQGRLYGDVAAGAVRAGSAEEVARFITRRPADS